MIILTLSTADVFSHPMLSVTVEGETLHLLSEKGIYWPKEQMLLVADVHWGKAATFRSSFLHLPKGTTSNDLGLLSDMLDRTQARQLVFLGDLFHARAGKSRQTLQMIEGWRHIHRKVNMLLVRGNHDRHAGDPPDALQINCVNEPYEVGPFSFTHHPFEQTIGYNLCGHVHPAVLLRGKGMQSLRLPCFYFGLRQGILPSFGTFTGSSPLQPGRHDRIYVVADQQVIPVPHPHETKSTH
jgi:DNA ligase-associated metallophosphoesterase